MKKTKRTKCWNCNHTQGYDSNIVREKEWQCNCPCHVHANGHWPSQEYMNMKNVIDQKAYIKRLKDLGCVFSE